MILNSIGRTINSALQLSKNGGGVGLNLTNLRAAGAPIKGYDGVAAGVVPVMKLFEDAFSYANQLGNVKVLVLFIYHYSIQILWNSCPLKKKMRMKNSC